MKTTNTHVYFWDGPFSQWYKSPFQCDNIWFQNAEKWMMYQKAMYFKDTNTANMILRWADPSKIKKLGRQVEGFDERLWADVRENIVFYGNMLKFTQNSELMTQLINTGLRTLVEASPYDKVWGVGLKEDDPLILDESNWKGKNLLGKCLMKVRQLQWTLSGISIRAKMAEWREHESS